jgi:hypothetical protein
MKGEERPSCRLVEMIDSSEIRSAPHQQGYQSNYALNPRLLSPRQFFPAKLVCVFVSPTMLPACSAQLNFLYFISSIIGYVVNIINYRTSN